jgi:hypothetical protein
MTVGDLARELDRRGVPPSLYCLSGGLPNEQYTIEQAGGRWWVYYSERGCRSGLQEFDSEADACAAFLRDIAGCPNHDPARS